MDTVYDTLIEMAKGHRRIKRIDKKSSGYTDTFRFDLDKKSIFNGFIYIYKDGQLVTDKIILTDGTEFIFAGKPLIDGGADFFQEVEKLYSRYEYSVPTRYDNSCRTNFLAKHSDDLSFEQLMNGDKRPVARYALEAFVMFMSMCGKIQWNNMHHFFWQSKNMPTLILFREWCT